MKLPPARGRVARTAIVVGVVGLGLLAASRLGFFALEDRAQLAAAISRARAMPFVAPMFVCVYALAAAIGVPATPLTLAGGALFGIGLGIPLNWIGEMLAASLAFFLTRATGLRTRRSSEAAVTSPLGGHRSVRTLFRLRLVPIAPFALLNAGAALSGMTWRDYLLATAAGIVPITVIYTVSASELVAGVAGSGTRALAMAIVSATVLIAISFLPAIMKTLSRSRA